MTVSLELAAARLCAALGRCSHPDALPVHALHGPVVSHLCPDCGAQLPADWIEAPR